ncbi:hypothetical protein C7M52_02654 [Mixta theicola]|nr:hypothetical protein C7M52_02654 [Mixta theicola]
MMINVINVINVSFQQEMLLVMAFLLPVLKR